MKNLKLRYLIAGGVCLILGIVFLILGIVLPNNISQDIRRQTSQYGVLTNSNRDFWIQMPPEINGTEPTTLYRNFKIYNASNVETLYQKRPQFIEQDMITFYQNISFARNLEQRNNLTIYGSEEEQPGYSFTQQNGIHHLREISEEQNLIVPNKGALVVWNWLKEAPSYRKAFYGLFHYYNKVIPQYLLLGVVSKYLDILYPEKYKEFEVFAREQLSSFNLAQQHLIWNDTTYGIKK